MRNSWYRPSGLRVDRSGAHRQQRVVIDRTEIGRAGHQRVVELVVGGGALLDDELVDDALDDAVGVLAVQVHAQPAVRAPLDRVQRVQQGGADVRAASAAAYCG